jgi:hypothetical protein
LRRTEYSERWDLATIPAEIFNAEIGRRRKGDNKAGGRPRLLRKCDTCQQVLSGREYWRHRCPAKGKA